MDKKSLRSALHFVRRVNSYVLVGLCVLSAFVAVLALRSNNQHMIKLRNDVFEADKNNSNIEAALTKLRTYVYAHMNTNLSAGENTVKPPIQLKYQYERLTAAAKAKYDADTAKVVADATASCTAQFPGGEINLQRFACAQAYSAAHPVSQQVIPEALYKFDFASPAWSPDLAGWSIVAGCIFLLLLAARTLGSWFIKYELDQ